MRGVVIVLLAAAACLESPDVPCADGRTCPAGTLCDEAHATCVTQAQLDACAGVTIGAPCAADATNGVCIDGVCFENVCGNRITQPGEECDDGNLVEGDGCSALCQSEGCGNGRVDTIGSEECDDGNTRSSDGCDSTCRSEALAWEVRQCGEPRYMGAANTTFDPQRRVIVHVDYSMVMEWDGTSWRCTPRVPDASGYTWSPAGIVYDPVRMRVAAVTYNGAVYEWDGTSFTLRTTAGTAPSLSGVTYATTRGSIVGYGYGGEVWSLSSTSATWAGGAPATTVKPPANTFRLAFDDSRDRLVLLVENGAGAQQTWLWNPTTRVWTNTTVTLAIGAGTAMAYDQATQTVIAFGGATYTTTPATYFPELFDWNGTAWVRRTSAPRARAYAALLYRPDTSSVVVAGGSDATGSVAEIQTLTSGAWTRWSQPGLIPRTTLDVIGFPPTGEVIAVTENRETWRWKGKDWTKASEVPHPIGYQTKLAYDVHRARIVAYDPSGWMGEFDGTGWSTVAMDVNPITPRSMVFDAHRGRLLAIAYAMDDAMPPNYGEYTFQRTATGWERLPTARGPYARSAAYDMRARRPVIVTDQGLDAQSAYELAADDSAWIPIFDFGGDRYSFRHYDVVEYYPRGTALWIDTQEGATWERLGDLWRRYNARPMRNTYDLVAADPARQEVLLIARTGGQVFGYGYTSGAPRESCASGLDDDGDGLDGCADDDCWWTCQPMCPPLASCW